MVEARSLLWASFRQRSRVETVAGDEIGYPTRDTDLSDGPIIYTQQEMNEYTMPIFDSRQRWMAVATSGPKNIDDILIHVAEAYDDTSSNIPISNRQKLLSGVDYALLLDPTKFVTLRKNNLKNDFLSVYSKVQTLRRARCVRVVGNILDASNYMLYHDSIPVGFLKKQGHKYNVRVDWNILVTVLSYKYGDDYGLSLYHEDMWYSTSKLWMSAYFKVHNIIYLLLPHTTESKTENSIIIKKLADCTDEDMLRWGLQHGVALIDTIRINKQKAIQNFIVREHSQRLQPHILEYLNASYNQQLDAFGDEGFARRTTTRNRYYSYTGW